MSINLMMFVITSLFLLVILRDCSGVKIEGCSPETPKKVDPIVNYFKCVGINSDQIVSWSIEKMDHKTTITRDINAAVCYLGKKCENKIPNVNAVRWPGTDYSVLKVLKEGMVDVLSIGCKVFTPQPNGTVDSHDYTCGIKKTGLKIEGCSPESPKKVDPVVNYFECVGIKSNQHVFWNIEIMDYKAKTIQDINAAVCYLGKKCEIKIPNVNAVRWPDTDYSVLTVLKKGMVDVLSIGCAVFTTQSPEDNQKYYCSVA